MSHHSKKVVLAVGALVSASALLAGCSTSPAAEVRPSASAGEESSTAHPDPHGRVAVGYEGGVAVLDATTLDVVGEFESEEFIRLNAAGDGTHVFVSTSQGFQLLDTVTPSLTDLVFSASTPGHVVRHAENTVLFDDGTGVTTIVDSHALAEASDTLPETATYTAESAHHGVSIVLKDGTLLTTVGNDEGRTGAMALEPHDDHWHTITQSDECPGIHGEGTAQNEAVVFGCENGALIYASGAFHKVTSPDTYGRIGNAFVSETSPIVVGDYKNDPDAEGYLLNAVALIDTEEKTLNVVDLPENVTYTFRDIARGPNDLAYILATDGSIHVLDPETGAIVDEYAVIAPWQGPAQWQDAHPAIVVNGNTAYVTEPAKNAVHAVDLATGAVTATVKLNDTPNEIAVTLGAH